MANDDLKARLDAYLQLQIEKTRFDPETIISPNGVEILDCETGIDMNSEQLLYALRLTNRTFGDVDLELPGSIPTDVNYYTNFAISRSIEEVIERKGHAVVLDIGCGVSARVGYDIARHYGEQVSVIGVDINVSTQRWKTDNLAFVQADGTALPLADQSVDVVCSYQLMWYIKPKHQREIFSETLRVLKDGGHAVLDMFDPVNISNQTWVVDYVFGEGFSQNSFPGVVLPVIVEAPQQFEHNGAKYKMEPQPRKSTSGIGYISINPLPPHVVHIRKYQDK